MTNEIGITADAQPTDDFATIPDVPINPISSITNPNQIRSGVTRGTQTVVGTDSSQVTFGVVPNTTQLGVAQFNSTGLKIAQLGQQADGSSGLKFFDANGVGIAQFGSYASGSIALKVAKPNIEVGTATNDQLIFNSSQNVFKIVTSGIATIPTSGTTTSTVAVAHGLSYVPAFLAYALILGNYNTIPIVNVNTGTGTIISAYSGWSNATNINFQVDVPGGTVPTATQIKYFLLQESAATI